MRGHSGTGWGQAPGADLHRSVTVGLLHHVRERVIYALLTPPFWGLHVSLDPKKSSDYIF